MILLSSVQWSNGFSPTLPPSATSPDRRLILVVDAIQQLGAMGLDVRQTPVDFLVCGGHKWLNAPAGRGFLYVSPEARKRFTPASWGYLNVNEPPVGWANYFATPDIPAVRDYDFTADARRFEIGGTANYPGNVVLGASLSLINTLGIAAIEKHIVELTDTLIDRMRAAGALLVSPYERESRSGIVTFTLGQGPARDTAALQALLDHEILISQRYTAGVGGLRVSVHFFNNGDDIRALGDAVAQERGVCPGIALALWGRF